MSAKTTRGASQLSAYNSTSTALDSGSTFTGIWEDTIGFTTIAFSVKTDQAGSLYADFSTDGINLDSTLTYSVAASTNEVHRLTITAAKTSFGTSSYVIASLNTREDQ